MSEPLISVNAVTKQFIKGAEPALKDISAVIEKGQVAGLAGPDGAGKTTLIRLIAGLLLPTAGSLQVAGFDTSTQANEISNLIGYMPQKFGLYEDLSVMQNLTLYADLRGVANIERPELFKKLLSFTGLEPFTERLAKNLSGGMKQKLGLACALLSKPTLLLLDEPSVGVDPISRRELWKMVSELLEENITVIWSSSYLDEAERCDTVLLLHEGKLLYHGPPKNLTNKVEGRVFSLSGEKEDRRKILAQAFQQNNVIDGVIQGSEVRVVIKDKQDPPLDLSKFEDSGIKIAHIEPRFEDAYIDILGGVQNGGRSLLAENTPEVTGGQEVVVEAKGLTKTFGNFTAADNITFSIKRGETFGLLGPNGAGKSTTFKMMCGLLKPASGEALVNGLNLQTAPSEGRAQIGYMAQKFSLYGDLSVLQNLEFFSGIYNLKGKKRKEIVKQMADIFAFDHYLNESAGELPLGFKQRLALACSVMHHPGVLFLDEPTSGVDPITRREFWSHINGLVEKGVTVVVTTHFMDEAEYCDRIALVYKSKIIRMGTPNDLKMAVAKEGQPLPSLEDAFIGLIEKYEQEHAAAQASQE